MLKVPRRSRARVAFRRRSRAMTPPLPSCLRWRIVWAFHLDNMSVQEIVNCRQLDVKESTVRRVLSCYEEHNDVWPPGHGCHLGSPVMSAEDEWVLLQLLVDSPEDMLQEHFKAFCAQTGCLCHISTFCRAVKRLGYTRKQVSPGPQPPPRSARDPHPVPRLAA